MAGDSRLFTPMTVGATDLANRIVMAPLTRLRASDTHVPLPFVADYYAQRGCVPATLLISEATLVAPWGGGVANVPGIWNAEQVDSWKNVTKAVHKAGSKIFLQLWFLGRVANEAVAKAEGYDVVSSSPLRASDKHAVPRPLTEAEIWHVIDDFAAAAKNAVHGAGFDGVEIHGANGYLVDQFTKEVCNQRTDTWGGSIENRSRFAFELTKAVVKAVGAERTAIRLSPFSAFQGMEMDDPKPQYLDLLGKLKTLNIAYLHVNWRSHRGDGGEPETQMQWIIDIWANASPILICGWMNEERAVRTIDHSFKNDNVAIVFGRYFMSNPDLVFRLKHGIKLKESDKADWYRMKSEKGYIDEPFSKEWQTHQARL